MSRVNQADRSTGSQIRVLYVDDETDVADATSTMLEETHDDLAVESATSATAALDRLDEASFDCVVSDYQMPEMDGIEFLREVRETRPNLPFILFTGKGSESVASDAISAGVSDYLQKRSGAEQFAVLANRIETVVERHRAEVRRRSLVESVPDGIVGLEVAALEALPVGVVVLRESDGAVVFANERAGELFEAEPSTMRGQPLDITELDPRDEAGTPIPPEQSPFARQRIPESMTVEQTLSVRDPDTGGQRWLAVTWIRLDEPGTPPSVAYTVRDITDLKRQQVENRERLDRITDGFLSVDDAWRVTYANERAATFLDRDLEELLGQPLWDEFPEGVETGFYDAFNRAMSTQDSVEVEAYYEPLEKWFEATAYPSSSGLSIHFSDVTERRERERRYEAIFNQTYQFTVLLEPDGTLIEANETALSFGGLDREEVVGKKVWETYWFQCDNSAEQAREAIARASEGELVREEIQVQGAEEVVTIDASIRPVTDETGEVVLLVPEGRDITELKQRAWELQRQNERLDEFASVVSHDLQNPLLVANAGIDLAKKTGDLEHLEKAERGLERMETLIEDLLTLAREGQTVRETEPAELADVVTDAWRRVQSDSATLAVDLEERRIMADRPRLEQVLENLFRNAIDHGGEGVTITVGSLHDGFYVADDGPGIPPDERDEVFEHGYTTREDGIGFGLAIVRGIVEAHGWTIDLQESDTGGARFDIHHVDVV